MDTLQQLEIELKEAQLKVKIAKAANVLVKAFLNRDSFSFEGFTGRRFLFQNETFFSCFDHLKLRDVKNFEEIFFIIFDRKCDLTKDLKRALILIEKHEELSSTIVRRVADELIK